MLRRLNLFQYFLPCCLLGLMLVGLGGKLWLVFNFGTPIPDAAQWRAGIPDLVPEWAQGNVVLSHASTPTSFPLLARAVLGALVHANHQWDDRLTTVVNAFLLAGAFATILALGARRLGWIAIWTTALSGGLFVALPLGWDQSLAGSALPDRLALFLAFPAAWALLDRTLASPLWWAAAGALVLSNTAADWAVAVAIGTALVTTARLWSTRVHRGRDLAVLACAALAVAAHVWLHSGSLALLSTSRVLAHLGLLCEPWPTLPALALIIHAPLAFRCLASLRDEDRKHSLAPFAALVAGAVLALLWLAAEARPRRWGAPDAQCDILLLLIALGVATVTQLWFLRWQRLPVRLVFTVAWIALLVSGINLRIEQIVAQELPARAAENGTRLAALRHARATGDTGALEPEFRRCDAPQLRSVLPYTVQGPVLIERGPATTEDFTPLQRNQFSLPTPDDTAWAGGPAIQAEGGTLFISLPLPPAPSKVLRFRVAGDLGTPRFPFALRSTSTGETTALELEAPTGERWRTINLVRPADPVVIVAGPAALGTWGAFTSPVEMGLGSWAAAKLTKNWVIVFIAGGLIFAFVLFLPFAPRAPRRETFALDHHGRIQVASD